MRTSVQSTAPQPVTQSFDQALALAYRTNPRLLAARRQLQQVDENVPQALAGWRPRVTVTGSAGGALFDDNTDPVHDPERRAPQNYELQVHQPLYTSGEVRAQVDQAEAQVRAQRANLRSSTAEVLLAAGLAYLDVVRDRSIVALNRDQVAVQERTLQATAADLAAGGVAAADLGQAQARLASATAQLATAQGNLHQSEATFERQVGAPPGVLAIPTRTLKLPDSRDHAISRAVEDNPDVVAARETLDASHHGVDIERARLLPHFALNAYLQRVRDTDVQALNQRTNIAEGALSVTIPLYQGGGEYSRIRQAKESRDRFADLVEEMKRQARQLTATAWDFMEAARVRVAAQKQAIAGNQVAVRGYAVQQKVGARTLLDLLITQQDLLASEVAEVSAEHDVLSATLQIASATGLLDAPELQLATERFDPVRHYDTVRDKWIGTTPPK